MKNAVLYMRAVILLVGVVVVAALLPFAAADSNQGLLKDLVMDKVVSKVDGYPMVDAIVEKILNDCLKCHREEVMGEPSTRPAGRRREGQS